MKIRAIPLAVIATLAAASWAQAAVTVLGNGVAHSCYQFAEYGGNPTDGMNTCTFALEQTTLSVRDRAATYVNRGILRARKDMRLMLEAADGRPTVVLQAIADRMDDAIAKGHGQDDLGAIAAEVMR